MKLTISSVALLALLAASSVSADEASLRGGVERTTLRGATRHLKKKGKQTGRGIDSGGSGGSGSGKKVKKNKKAKKGKETSQSIATIAGVLDQFAGMTILGQPDKFQPNKSLEVSKQEDGAATADLGTGQQEPTETKAPTKSPTEAPKEPVEEATEPVEEPTEPTEPTDAPTDTPTEAPTEPVKEVIITPGQAVASLGDCTKNVASIAGKENPATTDKKCVSSCECQGKRHYIFCLYMYKKHITYFVAIIFSHFFICAPFTFLCPTRRVLCSVLLWLLLRREAS